MYSWRDDRWMLTEWELASPPYIACWERFDYRLWFLEALWRGGPEPDIPDVQSLVAVIPNLMPLLEEMAASDDREVSAAITEYLRDGHLICVHLCASVA